MPTILDLYKSATKNVVNNELYGGDASRIESKGIINIPRQVALLATSPNSIADLIGGQVSGLLKGSANRPSDTIFKSSTPTSKPISITGGIAIQDGKLKDTIEEGTNYFVKTSPSPASLFSKIKQGASTPLGLASATAASALSNPLATVNSLKPLSNSIKNSKSDTNIYGTQYMQDVNGKRLNETKKFSDYFTQYELFGQDYVKSNIKKRGIYKNWQSANDGILQYNLYNNSEKKEFEKINFKGNKITYVTITPYGNMENKIILPGTITGLTEDYSPEWSNFKYVGSPFYSYRYGGVEASIKFNIKMYYTNKDSLESMKISLTNLKKLVFPYEKLSTITYGSGENKQTQAVSFSPNLVYFSISGLYNNLFAYVEELGFSIDDNTSWATMDEDISGNKTEPYPTVIDVSLGFKIIPNVGIENKNNTNTLVYNFTSGSIQ